jgi:elongation factor Ts
VSAQINSETDFVARNELFQSLVRGVAARALAVVPVVPHDPNDVSALSAAPFVVGQPATVSDAVIDAVAKIRENIVLRRALKVAVTPGGGVVSA